MMLSRVKTGGAGVWGNIPMPPNSPQVKDEDSGFWSSGFWLSRTARGGRKSRCWVPKVRIRNHI